MEKNPFIGTWKNMTAESNGYNVGFTFKDDGTYTYWHSNTDIRGSGTYTYNDTHLVFGDVTLSWKYDGSSYRDIFPGTNQKYEWKNENQFSLSRISDNEIKEGKMNHLAGIYVKQ